MLRIAPSLLSADFGGLAEAVGEVASEADWLHIDVMDGHFVPNLTIGPPVVESLRRHTGLFFDCHLMMTNPGDYLEAFKKAGADGCSVHVEVGETEELLRACRELGSERGPRRQPRDAGRGGRAVLGARGSGSMHDRASGIRRPGIHARGAPEDRAR